HPCDAGATAYYSNGLATDVSVIAIVFFFFQAEDGIRDLTVTGVQTCALPISFSRSPTSSSAAPSRKCPALRRGFAACTTCAARRSEERRVGKECRSRWGRYQ